jgi:hypothetical protein
MGKNNLYQNHSIRKEFGSSQEELVKNVQTRVKLLKRIKNLQKTYKPHNKMPSNNNTRNKVLNRIDSLLNKL